MAAKANLTIAIERMSRFTDRTGLTSGARARRYLWTDAFAVCNLLGFARLTGEERHVDLARRLVDQVHAVLGRHRPDDARQGWLSGLSEENGPVHPTAGGLRIGKPLPERGLNERFDPDLEWERDGQYFHYLTKWIHALDQISRETGEPRFHLWARELVVAAHRAFVCGPVSHRRMMWKLSVDLRRPLVPSMGQHDPLDGLVTCAELEATARHLGLEGESDLGHVAAEFAGMLDPDDLSTNDPLGLGGLLFDAFRLVQIDVKHALVDPLLSAAALGLQIWLADADLRAPASRRLAFRELGLAVGLEAVARIGSDGAARRLSSAGRSSLRRLERYAPIRDEIVAFWLQPDAQRATTWTAHEDINDVTLATSLVPDGFLVLAPAPSSRSSWSNATPVHPPA
jgi:hypothetical protein